MKSQIRHQSDSGLTSSYAYQAGASLAQNHPTYIERSADHDLFSAIQQGKFCTVLGPAQTGKSSLGVQVRHKLETASYCCASLHATQLIDSPKDYYRWDKQLVSALWDSLFPDDVSPIKAWLQTTDKCLPYERLEHFSRDLLLPKLAQQPIVIFIDDIEALLSIPFLANDLFEWIQHCYSLRKIYPIYENLNFVIMGSVLSSAFSQQKRLLAKAQLINLHHFERDNCMPLYDGLAPYLAQPDVAIDAILKWTNGQPFLTQKLCQTVAQEMKALGPDYTYPLSPFLETLNQWIDQLVKSSILDTWHRQDSFNYFWEIQRQLTVSRYKKQRLERFYSILTDDLVQLSGDLIQSELLLSGIAIAQDGQLKIANEIYRYAFAHLL